jgi:hypothetical protein
VSRLEFRFVRNGGGRGTSVTSSVVDGWGDEGPTLGNGVEGATPQPWVAGGQRAGRRGRSHWWSHYDKDNRRGHTMAR